MLVLVPCDSFTHKPLAEPELMVQVAHLDSVQIDDFQFVKTSQHTVLENFAANAAYYHLQKVGLFDEILHFELITLAMVAMVVELCLYCTYGLRFFSGVCTCCGR